MEIQHKHDKKQGMFFVEQDGKTLAEMAYIMTGEKNMTILHTEVDQTLEGKGVGKQLLEKLIEFVRKENVKVYPQCPYANAMFKRTKEWQDVLVQS